MPEEEQDEKPPKWIGDPEMGRWCSRCGVPEHGNELHRDNCPGPEDAPARPG